MKEYNIFLDLITDFKNWGFNVDNDASEIEDVTDIKLEKFINGVQIETSIMIVKNEIRLLITEIGIDEDGCHDDSKFKFIFSGNLNKFKENYEIIKNRIK